MEGHHLFRETATRHRGRPPLLAPPPRRRWGRRPLLKLVSRRSPVCFYISLDPGFLVGELHPCSFFSFYSCLRICVSLLPPPTSASEFEATNYSAVLQKQVCICVFFFQNYQKRVVSHAIQRIYTSHV
uniref:Uncharacterized protein n=1 Tax=Triticum urartu TaxID=4572 RepID=A0A8R7QXD5_TRIUA